MIDGGPHGDVPYLVFGRKQIDTMQVNDGPSPAPMFLPPSNGSTHRPPAYVPGRIAPVRSPPKTPSALKPSTPPQRPATLSVCEEQQKRERVHILRQKRNTLICFGVSAGAFFLALTLALSLSKDIRDGESD